MTEPLSDDMRWSDDALDEPSSEGPADLSASLGERLDDDLERSIGEYLEGEVEGGLDEDLDFDLDDDCLSVLDDRPDTRGEDDFPDEWEDPGEMTYEAVDLSRNHAPLGSERSCVLGMNVERLRKRANLNKVQFSRLVDISRPMLDKIERGESNPRLDVIEKLARVLEVDIADLINPPFEDVAADYYHRMQHRRQPGRVHRARAASKKRSEGC